MSVRGQYGTLLDNDFCSYLVNEESDAETMDYQLQPDTGITYSAQSPGQSLYYQDLPAQPVAELPPFPLDGFDSAWPSPDTPSLPVTGLTTLSPTVNPASLAQFSPHSAGFSYSHPLQYSAYDTSPSLIHTAGKGCTTASEYDMTTTIDGISAKAEPAIEAISSAEGAVGPRSRKPQKLEVLIPRRSSRPIRKRFTPAYTTSPSIAAPSPTGIGYCPSPTHSDSVSSADSDDSDIFFPSPVSSPAPVMKPPSRAKGNKGTGSKRTGSRRGKKVSRDPHARSEQNKRAQKKYRDKRNAVAELCRVELSALFRARPDLRTQMTKFVAKLRRISPKEASSFEDEARHEL